MGVASGKLKVLFLINLPVFDYFSSYENNVRYESVPNSKNLARPSVLCCSSADPVSASGMEMFSVSTAESPSTLSARRCTNMSQYHQLPLRWVL